MTIDAVRDQRLDALEERLRAEAEALAGAAERLLAQAARLEGRPQVPDWCVPTLRRQARSCRAATEDLLAAAASVRRHAERATGGPVGRGGAGGPLTAEGRAG
ncbi:hypothetical protein [Streptomyces sp. NPDC050856]|uniref:hypothetical protein n=1 Tax=Streptomyces sp. NPDC050856 TaxID=3154939 RepID=UPI0033F679FC